MRTDPRRALAALALIAALAAGCARAPGPPPIADGAECATCGMSAGNRRFACEQKVDGRWRVYDSIECLARDRGAPVYLADYDTRTLRAADSLRIVHGAFASPMGGGYAAFADPAAASSLAAATRGRIVTLAEVRADAAQASAGARP